MIGVVGGSLQVVVLIVVCHQFHSVLRLKIKKGCGVTSVQKYTLVASAALS